MTDDVPAMSMGQVAFEAARDYQNGRDADGRKLLYWGELTPDIQDTWEAAALAVIKQSRERVVPPIRLM